MLLICIQARSLVVTYTKFIRVNKKASLPPIVNKVLQVFTRIFHSFFPPANCFVRKQRSCLIQDYQVHHQMLAPCSGKQKTDHEQPVTFIGTQRNAGRCHARNAGHCHAAQRSATQRSATQRSATQRSATQRNPSGNPETEKPDSTSYTQKLRCMKKWLARIFDFFGHLFHSLRKNVFCFVVTSSFPRPIQYHTPHFQLEPRTGDNFRM